MLDLLKETGKLGCKPVATPNEYNYRLCNVPEDSVVEKGLYQRHEVKLIYLSHTRPDIAIDVSIISQVMHDPREMHLQAVNRIL